MANQNIFQMMGDTVSSFSNYNNWIRFLECSGWNFKYTWPQQLLIYRQKPDSIACANQEVWATLGRYVKNNARIISIIDETVPNRIKVQQIIDVKDTESPSGKPLPLWSFNSENSRYVIDKMSEGIYMPSDISNQSVPQQLEYIITAYINNFEMDIPRDKKQFLIDSVICQVFSRCTLSQYFDGQRLAYSSKDAPDLETISVIGNYVQQISKNILLEINKNVKEYIKNYLLNFNKEVEKSERKQTDISGERRLPDSEHRSSDGGTGQIRDDEKNIPERRETGSVLTNDDRRNPDESSADNRRADEETGGSSNEPVDEEQSSTTEKQSGMGRIYGTDEENGGRNGISTDDLRIEDKPEPDPFEEKQGGSATVEQEYDLGAGYLGNGLTIWDRKQEEHNDYRTVAHISKEGEITFYDENLHNNVAAMEKITIWAKQEKEKNSPEAVQEVVETVLPSEKEQIEFAKEIEKNNSSEFLDREPLSYDIDIPAEVSEEEKANAELFELPSVGEVVNLQGTDYLISAITEKTVKLQDVKTPLFTHEMDKDTFAIVYANAIQPAEPVAIEEPVIPAESVADIESVEEEKPTINTESAIDLDEEDDFILNSVLVEPTPEELAERQNRNVAQEKPAKQEIPEVTGKTKRKRRTYPQLQYAFMEKYAPEFMNRNLDYIRLENDGYEPLYIERIAPNQFAIAHTFIQNGDIFYDPEMVFLVDDEKKEILPISYELSGMGVYTTVYDPNDTGYKYPDLRTQKDLQSFFQVWSKNLAEQGHVPVRAIKYSYENGQDIEFRYKNGKFIPLYEVELEEETVETASQEERVNISVYRVGDFYEAYGDGAKVLTELLDLHLTETQKFGSPVQMCGFPDFMFEEYKATLNEMGYDFEIDELINREPAENKEAIKEEKRSEAYGEYEGTLFDFINEEEKDVVEIPAPVQAAVQDTERERVNYSNPYLKNGIEENYGPPRTRYANNIAAIKLLKTLEEENRLATKEEQTVLSKYVGWGGLADAFDRNKWPREYDELKELLTEKEFDSARGSTLTAFYTPPVVLEAIYDTLRNFGFSKGNILEPACGTGNFFGMLPEDMQGSKMYGIELDSISGRIAQYLYPECNIAVEGFEDTTLPDNFFDATISNVPFGDFGVYDPKYNQYGFRIHDYFFGATRS